MTLDEFVLAARASSPSWPDADASRFADFVRSLIANLAEPDAPFEELRAGDLWLAFHAGRGVKSAIVALETSCFSDLAAILRARGAQSSEADEVIQRVRDRLLVAESGSPPRILSYQGLGALQAWVRVVAVRTWLNMRREGGETKPQRIDEALAAEPTGDIELELFKGKYRELFRRSFVETVEALPSSARLLLKLHYLDHLSMEDIGKILGVHRLTVLRRLERIRSELSEGTKERLEIELSLDPPEVESILRMIQSRFDVSLGHALEGADDAQRKFNTP